MGEEIYEYGMYEDLEEKCYEGAKELYGDSLSNVLLELLNWELDHVKAEKVSIFYLDEIDRRRYFSGWTPLARLSSGSSLIAYLCHITNVNPLPAHYYCRECSYFDLPKAPHYITGYDMTEKKCPKCGKALKKDGFNLLKEIFMGFYGDKRPFFVIDYRKLEFEDFVNKEIYDAVKPNTFSELMRVISLSSVLGAWENNGQVLIAEGKTIYDIVTARDDIMFYLMDKGLMP